MSHPVNAVYSFRDDKNNGTNVYLASNATTYAAGGAQNITNFSGSNTSINAGSSSGQNVVSVGGIGNTVTSSSSKNIVSNIANDLLNSKVNLSNVHLSGGGSSANLHQTNSSSNLIYQSALEAAILQANNPLNVEEGDEVTIGNQTGRLINRSEILRWQGVIPLNQYEINIDSQPEIISKKTHQQLMYEQEVAIRYLRPPTPPPPGEILIKQEANIPTPPAPPLVIRQIPPRPDTPPPLVVREAPPRAPASVGQKLITISGKRLPPPPRKVVIERLAPLPSKPQAIMIERWLPYAERKRRIIFQKNTVPDPIIQKPRNVIVQWEAPDVQIKTIYKDLGVVRANPYEYVERFGVSLMNHSQFPDIVRSFNIRPPNGFSFASEFVHSSLLDLEGDVHALNLINLDEHGLGEYRAWLNKYLGKSSSQSVISTSAMDMINGIIGELFKALDTDGSSNISLSEAQDILVRLNLRLGRSYTSQDAINFLRSFDTNNDGYVDYKEFRAGLLRSFASSLA